MNALARYLEAKKISVPEFAKLIGVHRTSVIRFLDGTRKPALGTAQRIHSVTKGKVKPEDFFQ